MKNPLKAPYAPWIFGGAVIGIVTALTEPFTGAVVVGWVLTIGAGFGLGYAAKED